MHPFPLPSCHALVSPLISIAVTRPHQPRADAAGRLVHSALSLSPCTYISLTRCSAPQPPPPAASLLLYVHRLHHILIRDAAAVVVEYFYYNPQGTANAEYGRGHPYPSPLQSPFTPLTPLRDVTTVKMAEGEATGA